jgi:hypothetical protein
VPDGKDGFTGVFLQRAAAGAGSVTAKGVTVVAELPAGAGAAGIPDLRAFGIEMVYVPEGPFALGSGGTEENRFYQYTDGSQNTRPYRVQDAGPVPTGPQRGRLWATGLRPDAGDAGELSVAYPNGYRAFYCMKHCVRQGQFAGFLGMQSVVQSAIMAYRGGSGPVLYRHVTGGSSLTWWMGSVFGAWAGLRPMTDLEYEKACRGAREPQPDEAGPSVWGIRHLNTGEMSFFTVTAADPVGRGFQGTHGSGLPALPADWPYSNERTVGGISRRGTTLAAHSDGGPCDAVRVSSRAGATRDEGKSTGVEGCFRGWRGVRTAPALRPAAAAGGAAGGAKLELEPLPVPNDAEIFVFSLAGRFQHGGDQAIPVEVETGLPEGCFPGGAASRTFTAAAKGATPFTMQVVVTRRTLQEARRVQQLPVRIRKVGGEVLAEGAVRLPLTDPLAHVPAVIGTRENGAFVIGMTNATDQALACSLEFAPVSGLTVAEGVRKVVLPAGGGAEARFAVTRPDPVFAEGYYLLPYRLVSAGGTAQTGEVVVEVRAQSRWWVEARLADAGEESAAAVMDGELPQAGAISHPENPQKKFWNADPSVAFQAETPAKGWRAVTHGASLWVRQLNPAPKTMISAATRVFVRADQEAVLKLGFETDSWTWLDGQVLASIDFGLVPGLQPPPAKVWVNGGVVKNTRPGEKPAEGTVALKKGGNTVLLRFEALPDSKGQFPHVFLLFYDAKTGVLIRDIAYDMEKKP